MHRTTLLFSALLAGSAPAQLLIATDGTSDAVVAFSPFDGAVLFPSLFAIPNTTQVAAIDVNGEIWISEQTGDRITRRDFTGTVLGTIGPAFPGGGFDNIRGMAFANGLVYVTNAGSNNGATSNSVVVLDPAGNHVLTFATNTLATSPFAVLPFQGDVLVSGFQNNKDVYRFTAIGTPVGVFHDSTTISPAHGLARAADGNVWCVGFTTQNVCKLDAATGAILTSFAAPNTPRGVYELGNGNVMWTNGNGVHVYDVTTQTSSLVFAGTCNHVNLYGAGTSASASGYGTGCDGLVLAANGLPQLGNAAFALRLDNVPPVSPVGLFAFGSTAVNPGLDLTGIGMPGCSAYTNLDIGLFTGGLVSSTGISLFPLPIPNNIALAGSSLASQGLSLSALTPLGIAASNGMALLLGN